MNSGCNVDLFRGTRKCKINIKKKNIIMFHGSENLLREN